jgi:UDP-glucose 4-epimerase
MKICITGNAGFIGSHLADHLLAKGYDVFGMDDFSGGFKENVSDGIRHYEIDLSKSKKVFNILKKEKPEIVFHLAADATEGRSQFTPMSATKNGFMCSINVLAGAIAGKKLLRFVYASSMSVYGTNPRQPVLESDATHPEDIYAINKVSGEEMLPILSRIHGFEYVIVRPHNVFGERQNIIDPYRNVIAIFLKKALKDEPFYIYGDGEQKRSFTYIGDFIPYMEKLAFQHGLNGEVFNIGPIEAVSINQLGRIVMDVTGTTKFPIHLPERPLEVKEIWEDNAKAIKMLGYETKTTLTEGIKKMMEWMKTQDLTKPFKYQKLEITTKETPKTWLKKLI